MSDQKPDSDLLEAITRSDFEKALRKGFWRSILTWFTQQDNNLLPFDEIRKALPVSSQFDIGMKEIPLDQIVGSVGRYQDFDRVFLPRFHFMSARWMSINKAHYQDIILPPIEVYKLGEVYFVRDGNHRVSVARQRGQAYIDASVTEITSPVPITTDTDINELIRQVERIHFFEKTGLAELYPQVKIELTLPGGYSKLLEHIEVHRWFMGENNKTPVSYTEAVKDWYDEVYLPLVNVIENQKVLNEFPGRTETDLYVWIIEHLWYLREEYKQEVSLEQAVEHYTREFSNRGPFTWLMNLLGLAAHRPNSEEEPKETTNE